jgi:predicted metalloprotease with PDZ domain
MERIEYRIGLEDRAQHLYRVEARFPLDGAAHPHLDLRLPVWTPGSYLVREYGRHLQDLRVFTDTDEQLAVRKVAKATWRVALDGRASRRLVARYRVYAHELTVRTSHLDGTHAFWNGATLYLYLDELRGRPARVRVQAPPDWRVDTALEPDPQHPEAPEAPGAHAFLAPDYDALVDAPVEAGTQERLEFSVAGKPHAIAVWGRARFDRQRFVDDVKAICEAQAQLFGGLPYERYTFLLHLVPGGHGGLEHRSSATLLANPFAFAQEKKYHDLLELVSHEFFHLWNGKRIRPAALGPFDYQVENYTRSLWVVEGWTSYYDRLMLRRAGRIPAARWLEKLGEDLSRLERTPGRAGQSLEEASWDAWIKLYRPDENTVNSTVSYYLKGSIAALLLDLEIRRRTDHARTLDDALVRLWRLYQAEARGYSDDELQPLVEEAVGLRLDDFFARVVRGREELDLDGALAPFGLALERSLNGAKPDGDEGEPAWLGANLDQRGDRLKVTEALAGGPAQHHHLYAGDEIIAWDGWRVDEGGVKERLATHRPGDVVRLSVFRRDELRELEVTLGRRPLDKIEVVPAPGASDAEKAAYQRWLGEPFPD